MDDAINPCVGLQNKEMFANKVYGMVCGAVLVFCTPNLNSNPELLCKGWQSWGPLSCGSGSALISSPFGDAAVSHQLSRRNSSCLVLGFPVGLNVGLLEGQSQLK